MKVVQEIVGRGSGHSEVFTYVNDADAVHAIAAVAQILADHETDFYKTLEIRIEI